MENYAMVNGKKIKLTEEQIRQLAGEQKKVELKELTPGETFQIGEHEFLVLEQRGLSTAVIRKDLLVADTEFGISNDYRESEARRICGEFAKALAELIGEDNIIPHDVNLTANDGLDDYGEITVRVSILTAGRYRQYVKVLDTAKPDAWWWLATPLSTPAHNIETAVLCVSPSGFIFNNYCLNDIGVRPFCILKSTIFVSR